MYLRLTASTDTGDYLATFGHSVGTIGRSDDCTLSLPDPERFVSRVHAEIHYSSGKYYIRDLSANGVYLNDGDAPLGKGNTAELHHGDRIEIGDFTISVELSHIPFDGRPPRVEIEYEVSAEAEPSDQDDDWNLSLDVDLEDLDLAEPDDAPSPTVVTPAPEQPNDVRLKLRQGQKPEDLQGLDLAELDETLPPDALPQETLRRGTAENIPERTPPAPIDDPFAPDDATVDPITGFPSPFPRPQRPKRVDTVDFAVFGPNALAPGHRHIIDVWAYGAGDFETVKSKAAEVSREQVFGRKAGLPVYHEAVIKLRLSMSGVDIADPSDTIIWHGDPTNASFAVALPASISESELTGTVQLSIDGVPFGKITFVAPIEGTDHAQTTDYERKFACIRRAFASYASAERAEVLGRLQGMRAVCPDLDVFLDVLSLRAGDDWEARLRAEVPTRDVFYLFWSTAASSSEWVTREWRMALDQRGLDYIAPVPLQDPRDAPPPDELSRLHFNDIYVDHIAYLRLRQESG